MASPDLSRIIYGLPEPALLVEREGTVVAANQAASRLLRPKTLDMGSRECSKGHVWGPPAR